MEDRIIYNWKCPFIRRKLSARTAGLLYEESAESNVSEGREVSKTLMREKTGGGCGRTRKYHWSLLSAFSDKKTTDCGQSKGSERCTMGVHRGSGSGKGYSGGETGTTSQKLYMGGGGRAKLR